MENTNVYLKGILTRINKRNERKKSNEAEKWIEECERKKTWEKEGKTENDNGKKKKELKRRKVRGGEIKKMNQQRKLSNSCR